MKQYALPPKLVYAIIGALLITIHYLIFVQFFPNHQNGLGHDYALFLPALLDGAFWQANNGLFSLPWFSPSFCGGTPKLANPNAAYLSIPQLFSFFVSPLEAIKLTFVLFSALGYSGAYLVLRKLFKCSRPIALVGATLFLFNGFYAHRLIIGHLTYHPFMLIPWISLLAFYRSSSSRFFSYKNASALMAASIMLAYMFYAGMINLIIPAMIAITSLGIMSLLFNKQQKYFLFLSANIICIGLITLGLCAFQITATLSFLEHFPRDHYPLPGIPNVFNIIYLIGYTLFIEPSSQLAESVRVNAQWAVQRHELEFGITLIPALIFISTGLLATIFAIRNKHPKNITEENSSKKASLINATQALICRPHLGLNVVLYSLLGLLLILPMVVIFYTPEWNAILKQIPLIKSSSTMVRWFCIYIPITIILSCLTLQKLEKILPIVPIFCVIMVTYIIGTNILTDREFYHLQNYKPQAVIDTYAKMKSGEYTPEIKRVGTRGDLKNNTSALNCYEPIFGYTLELFPKKPLFNGNTLHVRNGLLNIKNPACYQYPEANQCTPGDHFKEEQLEQAKKFTQYKAFNFTFSKTQKVTNVVSCISWLVVFTTFILHMIMLARKSALLQKALKA